MGRVDRKVAIVTGAASGLGEAQAKTLAREGAGVVITDLNEKDGDRVVADIQDAGGKALFIFQDVTNPDGWTEVIKKTVAEFGSLHILVNNAGIAPIQDFETTTLEEWRKVTSVNLDGVFLGTQAAVNYMKDNGGGSIVNMSSVMGLVGNAGSSAAYCASKGGVRLYSKAAAVHCGRHGYQIRVNSVHPGYIMTPMVEKIVQGNNSQAFLEKVKMLHPIGRLGEPQEIANGVLFLASDEASFITGSELVIDGGYTAQ